MRTSPNCPRTGSSPRGTVGSSAGAGVSAGRVGGWVGRRRRRYVFAVASLHLGGRSLVGGGGGGGAWVRVRVLLVLLLHYAAPSDDGTTTSGRARPARSGQQRHIRHRRHRRRTDNATTHAPQYRRVFPARTPHVRRSSRTLSFVVADFARFVYPFVFDRPSVFVTSNDFCRYQCNSHEYHIIRNVIV